MESPVVVENRAQFDNPVDYEETGFPFDDIDYDSNDHFQTRLNDIASRHPEFATHFRGFDDFPSLRRKRHTSGSSGSGDTEQQSTPGPSSSRFADHSFPSGFNRFPFTRHFEEDFAQEPHREDKPPEVPKQEKRGRKPNPYLPQHLSNTVDLGQKQAPVQERNQRSMSAPPENRTNPNKSSRVDQETSNQPEDPNMGKNYSRQPQQGAQQGSQQGSQPKERIIPIHVEGRDDPVMPKNPNLSSGGSGDKIFGGERVQTGFSPSFNQSTQFRRPANEQFTPNRPQPQQFARQQTPPTQQQQQQQYQQQQQQQWQQQQAPPPRQQATPFRQQATPPPQPMSNDPLDKIKSVRSDVMALMTSVEQFAGTRKDKEYLYLDEMLTRNLLKLDNVETEGKENIRLARKEAIKCIQTCINNLEAKAQAKEKELKNSGESKQPETNEPEKVEPVECNTAVVVPQQQPETNESSSEPPKFTSQATLIISPPKTTEDQPQPQPQPEPQPPVEKMEVDPSETKETTAEVAAEKSDSQEPQTSEQQSDKTESESSQAANKDTTQK